jgi:hypothetical protein
MKAIVEMPEFSGSFESHGYSMGVDDEHLELRLYSEDGSRKVTVAMEKDDLVNLVRSLISGRAVTVEELVSRDPI